MRAEPRSMRALSGLLALLVSFAVAVGAQAAPADLSGVVAAPRPVAGVVVRVRDASGREAKSTPSRADGRYAVNIAGMRPPLLVTAPFTEIDGTPGTLSALVTTDAGTANLTPLTSLVTQRALGRPITDRGVPAAALAAFPRGRLADAQRDMGQVLRPLLDALQVAPAQRDFITAALGNDDRDPLRRLNDALRVSVHDGRIVLGRGAERVALPVPPRGRMASPNAISAQSATAIARVGAAPTLTPIEHLIVIVGENRSFDSLFGLYQPSRGQSILNLRSQQIVDARGNPGPRFGRAVQREARPSPHYALELERGATYVRLPQPLMRSGPQRFPNNLPPGPFLESRYVPYTSADAAADPVHAFFQMWQQTGGDNARLDLWTWVAVTAGHGANPRGEPTRAGGELMGFFDMAAGDAPLLRRLADRYAISDNFHQSVMGGTGMNFFALVTGDFPVFSEDARERPSAARIVDPDPVPGSANLYRKDVLAVSPYVKCSDNAQPGVGPILAVLRRYGRESGCRADVYYQINNYPLPYTMEGKRQTGEQNGIGAMAPQRARTIADALAEKGITWKWYIEGRDAEDRTRRSALEYNPIGDPLNAFPSIVETDLRKRLVGLATLQRDIATGTLPAISFVVPSLEGSGHPGYSTPRDYEAFVDDVITRVQGDQALWSTTAIIVTTDESGGFFDSGPIVPIDFFGDGPRVPLIVVSPFARKGHVDHVYHDQASILKFIERNWRLAPLSSRSRDGLPDAVMRGNDYRPANGAAIGDLMTLFDF